MEVREMKVMMDLRRTEVVGVYVKKTWRRRKRRRRREKEKESENERMREK